MKVVLFCGGMGVRMGEATRTTPKPMIPIGGEPILTHIMRYYASYGHADFVVCVGYRGDVIVDHFRSSGRTGPTPSSGVRGGDVRLLVQDEVEWNVAFVDTGEAANIGQRLVAASHHLADDEMFLASYGDGLADVPIDGMIESLSSSGKTAMFASVRPALSYHVVTAEDDGAVLTIQDIGASGVRINGGFFVFRREILDLIGDGEDLVNEPFHRLIEQRQVVAYRHDGFFGPMDTMKDKQRLDLLWEGDEAPWRRRVDKAPMLAPR